jgi:hypothetical protein
MRSNAADRIAALAAERLRRHRIEPSAPLRSAGEAASFVRERRIVMATGHSSLAVLTEAIAGRPLPGSWMAHPEVNTIYRIVRELAKREDVLEACLVEGKAVLMGADLGPAVQRVAADDDRRALAVAGLPPLARELLRRVEQEGAVRMDATDIPTKEGRAARLLLERELLVVSESLHTERGRHTALVRPWGASRLAARCADSASQLTLSEAGEAILQACLCSAVIAPEREARRWLAFAPERIDALLAQGRIEKLSVGVSWLVLAGNR